MEQHFITLFDDESVFDEQLLIQTNCFRSEFIYTKTMRV